MFEHKFSLENKKDENRNENEKSGRLLNRELLEILEGDSEEEKEEKEEKEGSVNKEMLSLLQDIANEMKEAKQRDEIVLEKVESIQEKIAEISQKQLSQILLQAERIAKALMESGSDEALEINMQALTNTVTIDKEDLDKLLSDAYPTNRDIVKKVEERFTDLHYSLETIANNITTVNENGQKETYAIFDRIAHLKDIVESGNQSLANKIEGVRRSIPNRELY